MLISFIFIIVIAILVGSLFTLSLDDKELITSLVACIFVLGFNIAIFICCAIPDCKSKAIKDYTDGKYRKEITYKVV